MRNLTYRIDSHGSLTFVSPEWEQFAAENGATQLAAAQLLGRPLLKFVAGATPRQLYEAMIRKVREAGAHLTFPFRCDAPDRRRFLQMTIRPWGTDGVEFVSQLIAEEPRPAVPLLATTGPRSHEMIRMCSWCKKVATPAWREVEEAVKVLHLFDVESLPEITHDICASCVAELALVTATSSR